MAMRPGVDVGAEGGLRDSAAEGAEVHSQRAISEPAQFSEFAADGYRFSVEDSTASELVFTRKQA
jgi:cytoplasmic iron level regulating protein YaaA (DUF328/UPF0246 family)